MELHGFSNWEMKTKPKQQWLVLKNSVIHCVFMKGKKGQSFSCLVLGLKGEFYF